VSGKRLLKKPKKNVLTSLKKQLNKKMYHKLINNNSLKNKLKLNGKQHYKHNNKQKHNGKKLCGRNKNVW